MRTIGHQQQPSYVALPPIEPLVMRALVQEKTWAHLLPRVWKWFELRRVQLREPPPLLPMAPPPVEAIKLMGMKWNEPKKT